MNAAPGWRKFSRIVERRVSAAAGTSLLPCRIA
jgi:hypothetical protein